MDAIRFGKAALQQNGEIKSQLFARASVIKAKLQIDGKVVEAKPVSGKAVEMTLSDLGKLLRKKSAELSKADQEDTGPSGISNALKELKRIGESIGKAYDAVKDHAPGDTQRVAGEKELESLKEGLFQIVKSDAVKNAKVAIEKLVKDLKSGTGISNETKRALEGSKDFLGSNFDKLIANNSIAAIQTYSSSLSYISSFDPTNEELTASEIEEFGLSVDTIERIDAGDSYKRADQGNIVEMLKELRTVIDKGLSLVDKRDNELSKKDETDPKKVADQENQLDGLNERVKSAIGSDDLRDFIKLLRNIVKNVEDGHLTLKRAAHVAEYYEHRFGKGLVNLLEGNSLLRIKELLGAAESLYGISIDGKETNRDALVQSRNLVKGLIDTLKIDPFKQEKKKIKDNDIEPLAFATQKAQAAGNALASILSKLKDVSSFQDEDDDKQYEFQPHRLDHSRVKARLLAEDERAKRHEEFTKYQESTKAEPAA